MICWPCQVRADRGLCRQPPLQFGLHSPGRVASCHAWFRKALPRSIDALCLQDPWVGYLPMQLMTHRSRGGSPTPLVSGTHGLAPCRVAQVPPVDLLSPLARQCIFVFAVAESAAHKSIHENPAPPLDSHWAFLEGPRTSCRSSRAMCGPPPSGGHAAG